MARFYEELLKEESKAELQKKLKMKTQTINKLLPYIDPEFEQDLLKYKKEQVEKANKTQISLQSEQRPIRRTPSPRPSIPENQLHHSRDASPRESVKPILPEIKIPSIEITKGRYSPTSGTFHYPDLFMESLSKSPQFKPTAFSMPEVVDEILARRSSKMAPFAPTSSPIPTIELTNEYTPTHGNFFPSTSSLNDEKYESFTRHSPDESSVSGDRISVNDYDQDLSTPENFPTVASDPWSYEESESEDSEDEEESDEIEDGDEEEAETYHPEMVLSFERALEISNPTRYRSVSPTNDMFLETDNVNYGGLHYYNKNFVDDEYSSTTSRQTDSEKTTPKSILKCHRFSEFEESNPNPNPNPMIRANSIQARLGPNKKQVRIEEPRKVEVKKTADDSDISSVVVNHYSDIVKQFGNVQKPSTKVYLTYEELKAAAQMNEDDVYFDKYATGENDSYSEVPSSEYAATHGQIPATPPNPEIEKVRNKVHFCIEYFLDIVLFVSACWLYCFKDERLAIPIIILMVYRQLYDKIKDKLPTFKFWSKDKCASATRDAEKTN